MVAGLVEDRFTCVPGALEGWLEDWVQLSSFHRFSRLLHVVFPIVWRDLTDQAARFLQASPRPGIAS